MSEAPAGQQPRVRFGILSTANVTKNIIPAIAASSTASLVAVASRTLAAAAEFAAKNNIPTAHGSYEALLADPSVEAVYVPLPNSLHVEWVLKAIAAGKHVLCEKPLAIDTADIARIAAAAAAQGVVVAEAVMTLHLAQTRRVRAMLREGLIGRVVTVRSAFNYIRVRDGYRAEAIARGGGSLWDVGCYPIYLTRYLLGLDPCEAIGTAVYSSSDAAEAYDEAFHGTLLFDEGRIALQLSSSFITPSRTTFEVIGTQGTIVLPNAFKATSRDRIELSRLGEDGTTVTATVMDPAETAPHVYSAEVEDFSRAVRAGAADLCAPAFTLGTVRAILALHESARAGGVPVKIK